jgi:NADH dehydrogenase/NADH:ubiquinone oxidoreductase subunit G
MCKQFDITINNKLVKVNSSYNVLQACNSVNIDIPKFCYHEKLSIAGNCRMCLVEIKGIMKPIASCALPINNNMVIFTNSNLVKKAREGILEFILLNHPLDCPICDQGGECDLQDQALIYGSDRGRFYEYKRSVNNKNCGSLVKTVMTRCIHCTRCVRFVDEFIGNKYLGLIGRGSSIEISNFLSKSILSEVSGNLIDLCPVGALTSKPYSFVARP